MRFDIGAVEQRPSWPASARAVQLPPTAAAAPPHPPPPPSHPWPPRRPPSWRSKHAQQPLIVVLVIKARGELRLEPGKHRLAVLAHRARVITTAVVAVEGVGVIVVVERCVHPVRSDGMASAPKLILMRPGAFLELSGGNLSGGHGCYHGVAWRGRSCGAVGRTAQSARSDCVRGVRRASTPRLVWGAQGVRVGRMRASTTSTSMSRRGRRSSVGGRRPTCVAASASAPASGSPYARSAKPD